MVYVLRPIDLLDSVDLVLSSKTLSPAQFLLAIGKYSEVSLELYCLLREILKLKILNKNYFILKNTIVQTRINDITSEVSIGTFFTFENIQISNE